MTLKRKLRHVLYVLCSNFIFLELLDLDCSYSFLIFGFVLFLSLSSVIEIMYLMNDSVNSNRCVTSLIPWTKITSHSIHLMRVRISNKGSDPSPGNL